MLIYKYSTYFHSHKHASLSSTPLDLLLPGQYLCTGLDLFIHTEPDLFASMALVHSRIRRVFYLEPDESSGALGSGVHLHDLPGLNHHYRVFRVHGKGP
ncbi:hypothetical protein EON65_18800 [archaeon]|nr:MAG: hypothetical protein EON65_18800 [archaeon]